MAKTIKFPFEAGMTLTASIVPQAGGAAIAANTVTDNTNGMYTATWTTDPALGDYEFTASIGGTPVYAALAQVSSAAGSYTSDLLYFDIQAAFVSQDMQISQITASTASILSDVAKIPKVDSGPVVRTLTANPTDNSITEEITSV